MTDDRWIADEDDFEFEHEKRSKRPKIDLPKWMQYKKKPVEKLEFGDVLKQMTDNKKELYVEEE